MARRAHRTSRGLRLVSRARTAIVAPVVPHEMAARPMNKKPASMARVVYETGLPEPARAVRSPREAINGSVGRSNPAGSPDRRTSMTRVGFIGVGTMGLPMAGNLVKKGFSGTAFHMNPAA